MQMRKLIKKSYMLAFLCFMLSLGVVGCSSLDKAVEEAENIQEKEYEKTIQEKSLKDQIDTNRTKLTSIDKIETIQGEEIECLVITDVKKGEEFLLIFDSIYNEMVMQSLGKVQQNNKKDVLKEQINTGRIKLISIDKIKTIQGDEIECLIIADLKKGEEFLLTFDSIYNKMDIQPLRKEQQNNGNNE